MRDEEIRLAELAHRYCYDVYKQEVINSVVADYTLISNINNSKIAILKRQDPNAKDVLETAGYRVMQAEILDFKMLEFIIEVFGRKDAAGAAQEKPKVKPNATPKYNTYREEDKAYKSGSPSNWRYRNAQQAPKYAAGGTEDNLHTYSNNGFKSVCSVKTKKSISPLPIVIAVIAAFILIARCIPISAGTNNGILPDDIEAETQLLPTGEPDKAIVVLSIKNVSYKPVTDLYCTYKVEDSDGSISYKETIKICEALNSKEEKEFQHIITVPTDKACTVHTQCIYKTRII